MSKCVKCGTQTNDGSRGNQGEFICSKCFLLYGTMHYDVYDSATNQMNPPDLGDTPDDYILNYIYQAVPNLNVATFKKQYARLIQNNWTPLEIIRGIEYRIRIARLEINAANPLGAIPFMRQRVEEYYRTISVHHLIKYSKAQKSTVSVREVETNMPKPIQRNLINMEGI